MSILFQLLINGLIAGAIYIKGKKRVNQMRRSRCAQKAKLFGVLKISKGKGTLLVSK